MPFNENRESSRFYLKTIFEKFPNFNDLMVNEFYGKFVLSRLYTSQWRPYSFYEVS